MNDMRESEHRNTEQLEFEMLQEYVNTNPASKILFRCHKLGSIMPADKARIPFTQTQKTALVEIYTEQVEHRKEFVDSKYLKKGVEAEENSITLLSRVTKTLFKKNKERISNDFITGEYDIYTGESATNADIVIDIKSSWNRVTFNKARTSELDDDYYWQTMGYMSLSKAKKAIVAFCLVNGSAAQITSEKRKMQYAMGIIDPYMEPTNDAERELFISYKKKCAQIEVNHIYDLAEFRKENPNYDFDSNLAEWHFDIPMGERVHLFEVLRDEEAIAKIEKRVIECRQWIADNFKPSETKFHLIA